MRHVQRSQLRLCSRLLTVFRSPTASTSATDTGSDSSSTASYDDRRPAPPSASASRSMPPPPVPPSQSARQTPSRQPSRLAPPSVSGSHYSRLTPEQVAPPLPGYGPPRTRADPVRRRQMPDDAYSTGSSYDSASEEEEAYARRASDYHPAPASLHSRPPPPPRHVPSSIRSNAGSTPVPRSAVPSIAGGPTLAAGTPSLPLTASNLRAVSVPPPSLPPLSPAPVPAPPSVAPPGLDAALERIQVSLTALHERLTLLEEHTGPAPANSAPTSGAGPLGLLKETVNRLLVMVALRRSTPVAPPSTSVSSPALALRTRSAASTQPSFFALVFRLVGAVASSARRAAGDLAVVFAVAVLIGRLRGVDLLGLVVRRYLGGGGDERRRVGASWLGGQAGG